MMWFGRHPTHKTTIFQHLPVEPVTDPVGYADQMTASYADPTTWTAGTPPEPDLGREAMAQAYLDIADSAKPDAMYLMARAQVYATLHLADVITQFGLLAVEKGHL